MVLRLIVCISMDIFCIWQGNLQASVVTETGRHYFPVVYLVCVILLTGGLNRFGLYTWPLTTLILLLKGHFFVGWIPLALVVFNLICNEMLKRR